MLNRLLVLFMGLVFVVALFGGGGAACGAEPNVHQTKQAQSNECIVCHQSAYVAANNPRHQDAFPEGCHECHSTNLWSPLDKEVGSTIHEIEVVKTLACAGCHKDEYDKTTKPKHDPIYPTDCKDCHGTDTYAPTKVDIHTTTTFATQVATPDSCYPCHKEQYDTQADHKGYPKACGGCHNTGSPTVKAWLPTKTGG